MTKILIVSATHFETAPLTKYFRAQEREGEGLLRLLEEKNTIDLLICGIGMVPMSFHLTQTLINNSYDIVINAGIAGTFNTKYKAGEVVNVVRDIFAETGAESSGGFIPVNKIKGLEKAGYALIQEVQNPLLLPQIAHLPKVAGITVNTVSGTQNTIETYKMLYNPDVESMEGAAFLYVCNQLNQKALQLRAISNKVEPRQKDKWQISIAVENLNKILVNILEAF